MNATDICTEIQKALDINSETELIEFKDASGGFPKTPVRKTLSAFGNTKGGIIVFGVKEKADKTLEVVPGIDIVEEYGRGIGIVISKMDEWGLLPPILKNTANSFRVILPGEKLSQLNVRQVKIWEYLTDNQKVTRKDAEGILVGTPSQTINHDLRKMKEVGLILQEGQSSNIYYKASF